MRPAAGGAASLRAWRVRGLARAAGGRCPSHRDMVGGARGTPGRARGRESREKVKKSVGWGEEMGRVCGGGTRGGRERGVRPRKGNLLRRGGLARSAGKKGGKEGGEKTGEAREKRRKKGGISGRQRREEGPRAGGKGKGGKKGGAPRRGPRGGLGGEKIWGKRGERMPGETAASTPGREASGGRKGAKGARKKGTLAGHGGNRGAGDRAGNLKEKSHPRENPGPKRRKRPPPGRKKPP